MEAPEGYSVPLGCVCKLKRVLYGLKQALRQKNTEFTSKIQVFGFTQSKHDHCLFTKVIDSGLLVLLVHVDDILLAKVSGTLILEVKKYLNDLFTIKDLGAAKYFLDLEIARSAQGIIVKQSKYIKDFQDAGMASAKPATSPLPNGYFLCLPRIDSIPEITMSTTLGRCYSSFTISKMFFEQGPILSSIDFLRVGSILRCRLGLVYGSQTLTGYSVYLGLSVVSWKTKKQNIVSRTKAEAEYRSLGTTTLQE
ncbi:UNVERIFIED_CONTAM: hypothetical protein Sangu_2161000 [Sesamum angustifolium]|uniref:Reverse transcriptase Ty1/copia-type domain-containing protein n=1 Tax=Sesamum angustifolium TaxID=2727405 RepID=A0AAW2LFW1_9LAMI